MLKTSKEMLSVTSLFDFTSLQKGIGVGAEPQGNIHSLSVNLPSLPSYSHEVGVRTKKVCHMPKIYDDISFGCSEDFSISKCISKFL